MTGVAGLLYYFIISLFIIELPAQSLPKRRFAMYFQNETLFTDEKVGIYHETMQESERLITSSDGAVLNLASKKTLPRLLSKPSATFSNQLPLVPEIIPKKILPRTIPGSVVKGIPSASNKRHFPRLRP